MAAILDDSHRRELTSGCPRSRRGHRATLKRHENVFSVVSWGKIASVYLTIAQSFIYKSSYNKNLLAQNHQNWKTYHKIISRSRLRKGRLLTALELKNGTEIIVKVRSHARAIFTAILGKIFLTISMARKVRTCEQPAI